MVFVGTIVHPPFSVLQHSLLHNNADPLGPARRVIMNIQHCSKEIIIIMLKVTFELLTICLVKPPYKTTIITLCVFEYKLSVGLMLLSGANLAYCV